MINLAIIVAVSEYEGDVKSLPACKNDGNIIRTILEHARRFDEIYEADTSQSSQIIKREIAELVKKYHNSEIGEVVFYFSGHGESNTDDVFYCLGDYKTEKLRQTSIINSELDDQIRSLNPKLFTKICDSCYSGLPYVKNIENLQELFNIDPRKFSKIYFMCSSQQNEESFADHRMSYFTASFANSIRNAENGSLRHRDIMSAIADDFSGKGTQTPFFIAQSDHTDVFIYVNDAIKEALKKYFTEEDSLEDQDAPKNEEPNSIPYLSMAEKIKADAKRYCTKEEALSAVDRLKTLVHCDYLSYDLAEIYDIQIGAFKDEIPGSAGIGSWLLKNDRDNAYFARPKTEQETYEKRVPVSTFGALSALRAITGESEGFKLVSDVRTVVTGFFQTNKMDYDYIRIRLQPKLPNINPEECLIVPIFTTTNLRLFWSYSHFKPTDWDKWARTQEISWSTEISDIKDEQKVAALINEIAAGFQKFVEEPLRIQWGSGEPNESSDVD